MAEFLMCLVFVKSGREKTILSVIYVCPLTNHIIQVRRADGLKTRQLWPTIIIIMVPNGSPGYQKSKESNSHPKTRKGKGG